jgi:hypothetical protein
VLDQHQALEPLGGNRVVGRGLWLTHQLDDRLSDVVQPEAAPDEELGANRAFLAEHAEQQMLGADIAVRRAGPLLSRVGQHPPASRR